MNSKLNLSSPNQLVKSYSSLWNEKKNGQMDKKLYAQTATKAYSLLFQKRYYRKEHEGWISIHFFVTYSYFLYMLNNLPSSFNGKCMNQWFYYYWVLREHYRNIIFVWESGFIRITVLLSGKLKFGNELLTFLGCTLRLKQQTRNARDCLTVDKLLICVSKQLREFSVVSVWCLMRDNIMYTLVHGKICQNHNIY